MEMSGVTMAAPAATTKRSSELRIARHVMASALSGTMGSITRNSETVSASLGASKLDASGRIAHGDSSASSSATIVRSPTAPASTLEYKLMAAARPCFDRSSMKVGTKAEPSDPERVSETNDGSRNAIRYASCTSLMPNARAVSTTFARPAILTTPVHTPTVAM